ncbi:MAG: class II D-tagatose-bisphosphate aldolase, non-catalytic subunit [Anaerolineales bacterium]|nr:class II D-tagatose-bisphosphate aldolase, non-catalytic subunit [Anaerolineales bacterium]
MFTLNEWISQITRWRETGLRKTTLLAVCPNSEAVLQAAVQAAAEANAPMLFAATLNQVDTDGGYTGWTQAGFVSRLEDYAREISWDGPLYPCLDHGGPWLKDRHTLDRLTLDETMAAVKASLTASLKAGYKLLHIDPTVDRTLPPDKPLPVDLVVNRTVELIRHTEIERVHLGLPPVDYEVGTEEVHGGLVELDRFAGFLTSLKEGLNAEGLMDVWPVFIVAQVGTDLHTTSFDPDAARSLYNLVHPLGSLIKGHYTDWVENPGEYPAMGMGGANVGPEFTSEEVLALEELEAMEKEVFAGRPGERSGFINELRAAVVDSGRWQKWQQPEERGLSFAELSPERQSWMIQTGARYIWTEPTVVAAREKLYHNVSDMVSNPHAHVVDKISGSIHRYLEAFNLVGSLDWLEDYV